MVAAYSEGNLLSHPKVWYPRLTPHVGASMVLGKVGGSEAVTGGIEAVTSGEHSA